MGAAVDYCLELGMPAIEGRIVALAETLRSKLQQIDPAVYGKIGVCVCVCVW